MLLIRMLQSSSVALRCSTASASYHTRDIAGGVRNATSTALPSKVQCKCIYQVTARRTLTSSHAGCLCLDLHPFLLLEVSRKKYIGTSAHPDELVGLGDARSLLVADHRSSSPTRESRGRREHDTKCGPYEVIYCCHDQRCLPEMNAHEATH